MSEGETLYWQKEAITAYDNKNWHQDHLILHYHPKNNKIILFHDILDFMYEEHCKVKTSNFPLTEVHQRYVSFFFLYVHYLYGYENRDDFYKRLKLWEKLPPITLPKNFFDIFLDYNGLDLTNYEERLSRIISKEELDASFDNPLWLKVNHINGMLSLIACIYLMHNNTHVWNVNKECYSIPEHIYNKIKNCNHNNLFKSK